MNKLDKFLAGINANKSAIARAIGMSPDRINYLTNTENAEIYADEFYAIVKYTGNDLNEVAKTVLERTGGKKAKVKSDISSLGRYLNQFFRKKQDIAEEVGIKPVRFSQLINDKDLRPFAWEIYGLSKAINKNASEIFEELYGNKRMNTN